MRNRSIIAVGPLPPPLNGNTLAFQSAVDALRNRNLLASVVDLSGPPRRSRSTIVRLFQYMWIIPVYIRKVTIRGDVVYLTIAQSRRGLLRDLLIIRFARALGYPVVCHLHGGNYGEFYLSLPGWLQRTVRKMLAQVDKIIVLSDRLRPMFDFDSSLAERICVVHNGVASPSEPILGKHLPAVAGEPINILYLSNLVESKGYLDVLKAISIWVKLGINVQGVFAGNFACSPDDVLVRDPADARRRFDAIVRDGGLESKIEYAGIVSGETKLKLLRDAHFLVLPTNYYAEGEPISVIEGMAHGNVVIATPYRAIPDLVLQDKTGCLVPFGRPDIIADKVRRIVSEPARFSEMSRAAVEHYVQNFTEERYLEGVLTVLGHREGADREVAEYLPPERVQVSNVMRRLDSRMTIDFFNGQATKWGEKYSSTGSLRHRIELFVEGLRRLVAPGAYVLDFGCGTGDIAFACRKAGFKVVACDIAPEMIRTARSRYHVEGLEFHLVESPCLPFQDGRFDAVIASSVLEYADDPMGQLRELERILRPEGWFLATVPNPQNAIRRIEAAASRLANSRMFSHVAPCLPTRAKHLQKYLSLSANRYYLSEWQGLFEKSGLLVKEIAYEFAPLPMLVSRKPAALAQDTFKEAFQIV